MRYLPPAILAILAALTVALIYAFLPNPVYNPDANSYFGMALRLARGDMFGAAHLMHSPLLAIAMAPLVALGASIYFSFQVVMVVLAAAIISVSYELARQLGADQSRAIIAASLSFINLLPFFFILISGDLFLVFLVLTILLLQRKAECDQRARWLICVGAFAGAAYLAKAIEPFILLAYFTSYYMLQIAYAQKRLAVAVREGAIIFICMVLVSAPWVSMISIKNGAVTFSGLPLVFGAGYDQIKYHPDYPVGALAGSFLQENERLGVTANIAQIIKLNLTDRAAVARELFEQLFALSVNPVAFLLMVALLVVALRVRHAAPPGARATFHKVALMMLWRSGAYFLVAGPYLRHYFPVIVFLDLLTIFAVSHFPKELCRQPFPRAALRLFVVGILAVGSIQTFSVLRQRFAQPYDERIDRALSFQELRDESGPLIGNLDQPMTGFVAYALRREAWGFTSVKEILTGQLLEKLRLWKLKQVLWFGEPPPQIFAMAQLHLIRDSGAGDGRVLLFAVREAN